MDFLPALKIAAFCVLSVAASSAELSPNIRINQIGFHPQAPKKGVVVNTEASTFFIATTDLADTVYTGHLGPDSVWTPSGERARLADFSACTRPGQFVLGVPGLGVSHPFRIDGHIDLEPTRGAIRAFYYQRASSILLPANAGKWARSAGHPDNRVFVHPSAAGPVREAETLIAAAKGWYDAGDYNKYVVNSGITTYTLLSLYRGFPAFFDTLKLNIPESGNSIPDLLDECLWNLRWMLAMQDPSDGGVYHKLTTPEFSGFVMPEADKGKRYVVAKSVTATLDLAATAAYAARLFKSFNGPLPGFADSALAAARKAWTWARAHPEALYRQADLNKLYTPAINTGDYGDGNASDELFWAGTELYLATREDSFFVSAAPNGLPAAFSVPSWGSVSTLGLYSLSEEVNHGFSLIDSAIVRQRLNLAAAPLRTRAASSPYGVIMGSGDFYWGSNSTDANQGMLLVQAFRATGDSTFLKIAVDALDYLLGRNATGYSFVTGYGSKTPMIPHHRPSSADGVLEPVPGFLVGGPNSRQDDKCVYPSSLPALSYSDTECSFASNEVAINWNAPLAYLAGALEAIYGAGVPAIGVRPRSMPGAFSANLIRSGKALHAILPEGWTGGIEVFDVRGARVMSLAANSAGSRHIGGSMDRPVFTSPAGAGYGATGDSSGGIWIWRLRAKDGRGREVVRTGSLGPTATMRVELGR
ncbi:MAG: glycoside hydrolase family 9 protein [Fibrobacteria bacterium]